MQQALTVTQINKHVRELLEEGVGFIAVEGEISTLNKPSSGHCYFTLKDNAAQLRCAYFRNRHQSALLANLEHGQQVVVYGHLSLYEPRGDYQLIVDSFDLAGKGDLFRQFEALKAKLDAQGLFAALRKKSLPTYPQSIAIVTSKGAAALQDILTTLGRRYPLAEIVLYPSEVQGKQAAHQLVMAINQANEEARCDVLILARGGGSMEDLWAFNNEQLAYTIVGSILPIVTGIGHETDFTIADFVADHRAATPTAAAEAVAPNWTDVYAMTQGYEHRLVYAMKRRLGDKNNYLQRQVMSLHAKNPQAEIKNAQLRYQKLQQRLSQAILKKLSSVKQQVMTSMATLHAVSPLATLDRGYSITMYKERVVYDSATVNVGDALSIRLSKGQLICSVLQSIS